MKFNKVKVSCITFACLFCLALSTGVYAKNKPGGKASLGLTLGYPAVVAPSGQIVLEYTAPECKKKNKKCSGSTTGTLLGKEILGSGVWEVFDGHATQVGTVTLGKGDFLLTAELDKKGNLVETGSYNLYGSVDLFATGPGSDFVGLVLGADIIDFGYINGKKKQGDVFEFVTTNFTGFMCDFFGCTVQEGAVFRSGTNFSSFKGKFCCGSKKDWKAFTDGHMWVPVPAAVWLFGSGLLGLFGVATKRRHGNRGGLGSGLS